MSLTVNAMSLKLKMVLVTVATVVVAAGWFLTAYRPTEHHVTQLHSQVATEKQQVASLEAQLAHLQALQRNAPKLQAQLSHLATALPTDPGLPQFILQLQDAANKAGVDFLSVTPSLPAASTAGTPAGSAPAAAAGTPTTNAASGLKQISVAITTTGKYFTLENFIYRLEHLNRALRIDTFSISGGSGATAGSGTTTTSSGSPTVAPGSLSVSLNMRMFMSPTPITTTPSTTKAGA
jgi:type IV pilus assembly protein PilO